MAPLIHRSSSQVLLAVTVLSFLLIPSSCSDQGLAGNYTFMKHATESPEVSHYDYIIIGGGTAGCPLAATLSQHFNVLLLERGGSPYGNSNVTHMASFSDTLGDTSPQSASQRFVSEDGVINARARVLGGGSCLNAGFYTRASTDYINDAGLDMKLANDSYRWVERTVVFEPPVRSWQSAVRNGLLEVGVRPYNGFTFDHIIGTKVGGTIFDVNGNRHTAADLLEHADPQRLTVLLHARVSQILFNTQGGDRPSAHGVIYHDSDRKLHKAYINDKNGEIILSAGALGSPQLLMLSGVGPAKHLQSLGITVVLDQPLVGQGMSDNPMNAIYVPSPRPVELSLIQVVGITRFGSYIECSSGQNFAASGSSSSSSGAGRRILPRPRALPRRYRRDFGMFSPQTGQLSTVPPKQRTPEAIARAVEAMNGLDESAFRGGFILEKIMGPLSTGHLELSNRNPDDNPRVTFNYFKEPEDLRRCVEGMRTIERVIESRAFSAFKYPLESTRTLLNMSASFPVNLLPKHVNDSSALEQFCKDTVMTIWHYHGGCQVGRVVDRDYRVIGVDGLRVVDGSTFNTSPGTNPQATVMMLGRYMGVKILNQRLAANGE